MKSFLYQSPTAQIGMTCTYSKKAFTLLLKKAGLDITVEQVGILNHLLIENKQSMKDLAQKTFTENSSITRIVDNLFLKKLVTKVDDEKDRRLKRICITRKGEKILGKANEAGKAYVELVTKNINKEELSKMIVTLEKLRNNISEILILP